MWIMQIGKASGFRHHSFVGSNPTIGTNAGMVKLAKALDSNLRDGTGSNPVTRTYGPVDYANRHS